MKLRNAWLPLLAAALAVPGAVRAQEDDDCPCPRPGMIGVVFDDGDDVEGVRIIEVRRGSPAAAAGVQEGDVVIRLNGRDAEEAFDELPRQLQEGDTVRLRIRPRGEGGERELVVVAAPRAVTRFGFVRPGQGGREGPMIFMGPDSFNIPLEELTIRLDSLNTRLFHLDSGMVRLRVDSLVNLFRDSANVFIERMPNVEFHMDGPDIREEMIWRNAPGDERPFFLELGRRAAAGAELAEMNEGLRRYFDGVESGALVIDVSPNTPAARAGLEAGDVIVRAGGRDVNDPEDVRRALMRAEDGRVALEVVRQGRRRELSLEWEGADRVIRSQIAPTRVRVTEPPRVEPRRAPARPPRN